MKLGEVSRLCNPSTWEAEAGGQGVSGHLGLLSESQKHLKGGRGWGGREVVSEYQYTEPH
jgi:hypothetical protein